MHTLERTIYDKSGTRRVRIFQESIGFYSFVEETFSPDQMENCWLPIASRRSKPICDSIDTALREAKQRIAWLADA
jgi:hypothetical protein